MQVLYVSFAATPVFPVAPSCKLLARHTVQTAWDPLSDTMCHLHVGLYIAQRQLWLPQSHFRWSDIDTVIALQQAACFRCLLAARSGHISRTDCIEPQLCSPCSIKQSFLPKRRCFAIWHYFDVQVHDVNSSVKRVCEYAHALQVTRNFAMLHAKDGVRINSVNPGYVLTDVYGKCAHV